MKYTVELSDVDGNSFDMVLSLPVFKKSTDLTNSTWKSLEKGWIKHNSGGCAAWGDGGWASPGNLELCIGKNWIINFDEFFDIWATVNDSGSGTVVQSACLAFKPGAITWAVLS